MTVMTTLTSLELIRRVPLFAMLTDAQTAAIADAAVKRRFKRGQMIVEQGKKSNALFVLLNGRARVVLIDGSGREVILATLQPGDQVGEMSLIDRQPHSTNVRAEVMMDVLMLERMEFMRFLPDESSIAYAVMRGLVQRLRHADRRIESLALMDVYGRVARVLLDSAEKMSGDGLVIHEKISRRDIAKRTGASREMVSRVMKNLQERGYIEPQDDGTIALKDLMATYN
jgi:CRP-like cAMP-binding protein